MKIRNAISCLLTVPIFLSGANAFSAQNNNIEDAIKNGKAYLDMRYRYEFVDQENLDNANASTLRTKLGYKTGDFKGVSGLLEFENILEVGERRYSDGHHTNNASNSNRATVADPKGTQVNQVYLDWKAPSKTNIRLGRQVVNLDNQRFIGSVGWRQNDQTFDAAVLSNNYFKDFNFTYAFVERVNRIFGDGAITNAGTFDNNNVNLFNVSYSGLDFGKITVYDYLLDVPDSPTNSSKTAGIRFAGKYGKSLKAIYAFEYAHQNEYGDNTTNYSADYVLAEVGVANKGLTILAGYEGLTADSTAGTSFKTPLATGHKFNGWADKFLSTPANGLVDFYGTAKYKINSNNLLNGLVTSFTFHDFTSDKNHIHYGEEYDFLVKKRINKNYDFGVKVAFFKADETYTDTAKIMAFTGVKF